MLDVLDVGFQRAHQVSWFPEVGCVRCGFSEATQSFSVPLGWMCYMWVCRGQSKFSGSLRLDVLDVEFNRDLNAFCLSEFVDSYLP